MTNKINIFNAEHYNWGKSCEGWHLVNNEELSVIHERVPPGESEIKHYHNISRQFFFILKGEATIELPDKIVRLSKNEGLEISPGTIHKFKNESDNDVIFLVISSPKSHNDRVECE